MTLIAQALCVRLALLFAPPSEISTSEWADKYAVLSPETAAEPGRWHTRSYQREPMDAVSDPAIARVVIKSATQMLKTSTIKHGIARAIDVDPGPIMILVPRKEDTKEFIDDHLGPMIRDTERLRRKIKLTRHGKAPRHFNGGRLIVTSAGSPGNVAGKPIRYLFCDEVDKYVVSSGPEGNPIDLGRRRLVSYLHRAKEIDTCSPTAPGSEIDTAYELSDQREFFVPCPYCGTYQSLMGKFYTNVKFNNELETREQQAATARYLCEGAECGQFWDDTDRQAAVAGGEWRAKRPFNGIAGFWISELYSLQRSLREIVLDFLRKKDKPNDFKTFVNTTLAENWTDKGEAPEWEILLSRRENYPSGIVPLGGLMLIGAGDVQHDRIEIEIVAFGRRRQTWSVDYKIFPGNTAELIGAPGNPSPWEVLSAYLAEIFPCEGGGELPIELFAIDSGDQSHLVYEWVRHQRASQVVAVKGGPDSQRMPVNQPSAQDINLHGRVIKSGLKIRLVCGAFFKEQLYVDLRKRPPTKEESEKGWTYPEGYCHFPEGENYGDEHFKQLCAEQLVTIQTRTKRQRQEWQRMRPRNEALDCRVYAMAAAWMRGLPRFQEKHWIEREMALGPKQDTLKLEAPAGVTPPAPAAFDRAPESRTMMPAAVIAASQPAGAGWVPRRSWFGGRS